MKCFVEFFQNAYYHCLQYLVNKRLHWFERLFWFLWILLSLIGMTFIVGESVNDFYSTKASIRVRTDYLDFVTPFPALFFCEKKEIGGKMEKMLKEFNITLTDSRSAIQIANFVRAATFIRPLESNPRFDVCEDIENEYCKFTMTYKEKLSAFLKPIRASCEDLFASCSFNGNEFNCCEHFLPVDTFEGKCYAINSLNAIVENRLQFNLSIGGKNSHLHEDDDHNYAKPPLYKYMPFMLRHTLKDNPANLSVELAHSELNVWYMGNDNVPTKMYQKDNNFNDNLYSSFRAIDIYLRVQEVVPDSSIFKLEMERRNCRFWHETNSLKAIKIYSNSACEIECLRRAQLAFCGCVLHLLPNQNDLKEPLCNHVGVHCTATAQRPKIKDYLSFGCKCISDCHHFDVFTIGFVQGDNIRLRSERSIRRMNFVAKAPTVLYVRHADQDSLDFIVSIGGAITLFVGCSFLSLAQILYYFLLKPLSERILMERKQSIK